jgi:type II secretory pathway component PulK
MLYRPTHLGSQPRRGFVLIAVMVVIALLTLAAYQYSKLMMAEYQAAVAFTRATQARAAAESGVNYAAMMLSDSDAFTTLLQGNPYDNSAQFSNIPVGNGVNGRQVYFSVVSPMGADDSPSGAGSFRFGAIDESGKINLNSLLKLDSSGNLGVQILTALDPRIDSTLANAILDWLDPDSDPRQGGAEDDSYTLLGYHCKNGPLDTLEELLFVQGMTPDLLFGTDRNRNGVLDADESASGGQRDLGLQAYLTVYSREQNVDSTGQPRLYINTVNTQTLYQKLVTAVGQEMANYILAYRQYSSGTPTQAPANAQVQTISANDLTQQDLKLSTTNGGKNLQSLFELIGTEILITSGQGRNMTVRKIACPLNDASRQKDLLPMVLDKLTTSSSSDVPARINVNTAPQAVLTALPGLQPTDVSSIMSARQGGTTDPIFNTPAWLLTEAHLSANTLKTLDRFVTARTQVYRVQVVGHFGGRGPSARIEAVIDTNRGRPRITYWRDLSELGRGFDLPAMTGP